MSQFTQRFSLDDKITIGTTVYELLFQPLEKRWHVFEGGDLLFKLTRRPSKRLLTQLLEVRDGALVEGRLQGRITGLEEAQQALRFCFAPLTEALYRIADKVEGS